MKINKYFYYLIMLNMISNVIIHVPKVLFEHRYNGAFMAILLSVPLSLGMMWAFTRTLAKHPEASIDDLFRQAFPGWIRGSLLLFFIFIWFSAGALSLLSYVQISIRFVIPEMNEYAVLTLFLITVSGAALCKSSTVLYGVEIFLVINSPFIAFLFFKTITIDGFSWNSVMEAGTYVFEWPTFAALAAATFTFTGYVNMAVFHKIFRGQFKPKFLWLVGMIGLLNLLTTYLVPIGLLGFEGVGAYTFPWIVSADAIRMAFGPVERAVFVFLLLYISITMVSAIVHWHVGLKLVKFLGVPRLKFFRWRLAFPHLVLTGVVAAMYGCQWLLDEQTLLEAGRWWLQLRFVAEFFIASIMLWIGRRKKGENSA